VLAGWLAKRHERLQAALRLLWVPELSRVADDLPAPTSYWPVIDPDDADLQHLRKRLADAHAVRNRQLAVQPDLFRKADPKVKAFDDKKMLNMTGQTQEQWDHFVKAKAEEIFSPEKLELRTVAVAATAATLLEARGFGVTALGPPTRRGVFAAAPFKMWEVIGPLGGVIARKVAVEQRYFEGHSWLFRDPYIHAFETRPLARELRTEQLLVDQRGPGSPNLLRYVADWRGDGVLSVLDALASPDPPGLKPAKFDPTRVGVEVSVSEPKGKGLDGRSDAGSTITATSKGSEAKSKRAEKKRLKEQLKRINCKILEVLVEGWPYAMLVATRAIAEGEELIMDVGETRLQKLTHQLRQVEALASLSTHLSTGVSASMPQDIAAATVGPSSPELKARGGSRKSAPGRFKLDYNV
jgi:hypothetical protein